MGRRSAKRQQQALDRAFLRIYREDSLREHNGKCSFCFDPLTYKTVTADHREAKSKGGLNNRKNIISACQPCNKAKSNMKEGEFRKIIKSFPSGQDTKFILAWMRRRINLATDRAIDGIKKAVGME